MAPGGEFTSSVYGEPLRVIVINNQGGTITTQDALTPLTRAFRCVVPLRN